MRIPRLYVCGDLQSGSAFELNAEAANYLGRVLRLSPGAPVTLFNDTGLEFDSTIQAISKRTVTVAVGNATEPGTESSLPVHLGLVMSRGDRMDYAIQKSCELGVASITPLDSTFCEVRLAADRAEKRLLHWQQVAISASEQCGRTRVARLEPVQSLSTWLNADRSGQLCLVAHPGQEQALSGAPEAPKQVTLLVGPEGGLSEAEVEQALAAGFKPLTLGQRILRTETAPLVAISWLQTVWGDFKRV